jgi:hypothetical protein
VRSSFDPPQAGHVELRNARMALPISLGVIWVSLATEQIKREQRAAYYTPFHRNIKGKTCLFRVVDGLSNATSVSAVRHLTDRGADMLFAL